MVTSCEGKISGDNSMYMIFDSFLYDFLLLGLCYMWLHIHDVCNIQFCDYCC